MRSNIGPLMFAVFVLILPAAALHSTFEGSYFIGHPGNELTFWVGPVSTTIPFILLASVFLAHSLPKRVGDRDAAYGGAVAALIAMTSLTYFIIAHPRGPDHTSTMAIALFFTPPLYVPVMAFAYACGAWIGMVYSRKQRRA